MKNIIIIVDPFSSGALYAPLLKQRGFEVLAVFSEPEAPAFLLKSYHPEDFLGMLSHDGDIQKLSEQIVREVGNIPMAVIPGTESGVLLAEELAAFWQLPSNPKETSLLRRNKFLMNEHLKKMGIPAVKQKLCETAADALTFYKMLQTENSVTPMILKPIDSSGTDGVRLVYNTTEIKDYFQQYQGKLNILGHPIEQILAQEYLQGVEFVVDAVSCTNQSGQTKHFVTNVCQYKKEPANGSNFVYREMRFLDHGAFPSVLSYAEQVLDALGFRFGACHCELMLTERGPILIEVAGRIHGGFGPKIVEECSSHSLLNLTLDSYIAHQDWDSKTKNKAHLKCHALEHFFISRQSGKVLAIHFKKEIEQLPSYYYGVWSISEGKMLAKTTDLGNAPCWIVLVHQSQEQLQKDQSFLLELESTHKIFSLSS